MIEKPRKRPVWCILRLYLSRNLLFHYRSWFAIAGIIVVLTEQSHRICIYLIDFELYVIGLSSLSLGWLERWGEGQLFKNHQSVHNSECVSSLTPQSLQRVFAEETTNKIWHITELRKREKKRCLVSRFFHLVIKGMCIFANLQLPFREGL